MAAVGFDFGVDDARLEVETEGRVPPIIVIGSCIPEGYLARASLIRGTTIFFDILEFLSLIQMGIIELVRITQ